MKTKLFIIASLLVMVFNANAALEIETTMQNEYNVMPSEYNNECTDPDCMFSITTNFEHKNLLLDKKSDITICTEQGVTIFMGNQVKMIDCSNWQAGNYKVMENGIEKFKFSI